MRPAKPAEAANAAGAKWREPSGAPAIEDDGGSPPAQP